MSFLRRLAAGALDAAARGGEQTRTRAQTIVEKRGDSLTNEQRQKLESFAFSEQPEQFRGYADRVRNSD